MGRISLMEGLATGPVGWYIDGMPAIHGARASPRALLYRTSSTWAACSSFIHASLSFQLY